MSGMISAMVLVYFITNPLAMALGWYPISLAASSTISLVSALTPALLFNALETVAYEIPIFFAISFIVTSIMTPRFSFFLLNYSVHFLYI